MIKNIIFDLGNVLLDFSPKDYLKKKIDENNIEPVYEAVFKSEEWPMLDRGTITENEAKDNIISRNKMYEDDIVKTFENWYELLVPITINVNIMKALKEKGYKIYYLSNFHSAAFEYVTGKYEFFKTFDGGVVSFKEKKLKPEKEIYEILVNRYNLKPEESIFIDDVLENVEGASKVGIQTVHLYDIDILKKELSNLGVDI